MSANLRARDPAINISLTESNTMSQKVKDYCLGILLTKRNCRYKNIKKRATIGKGTLKSYRYKNIVNIFEVKIYVVEWFVF